MESNISNKRCRIDELESCFAGTCDKKGKALSLQTPNQLKRKGLHYNEFCNEMKRTTTNYTKRKHLKRPSFLSQEKFNQCEPKRNTIHAINEQKKEHTYELDSEYNTYEYHSIKLVLL